MTRGRTLRHGRTRGFTWVEVSFSVLLLSIAAGAVSSLLIRQIAIMRMNGLDTVAKTAVLSEIERLRTRPWTEIAARLTYPSNSYAFCVNSLPNGSPVAVAGCTTGLQGIPDLQSRVYVEYVDMNGDGVANAADLARKVTAVVSVYGSVSPLDGAVAPPPTSGPPPSSPPPPVTSDRSVWAMVTYISERSQDGL